MTGLFSWTYIAASKYKSQESTHAYEGLIFTLSYIGFYKYSHALLSDESQFTLSHSEDSARVYRRPGAIFVDCYVQQHGRFNGESDVLGCKHATQEDKSYWCSRCKYSEPHKSYQFDALEWTWLFTFQQDNVKPQAVYFTFYAKIYINILLEIATG